MKKEPEKASVLGAVNNSSVTPTNIPTMNPTPTVIPVSPALQKRSIALGLVVEDYSNRTGQISSREEELGRISTISIFKQFGLESNKNLAYEDLAYIKSKNMKLLIAWEPWNPQEGMSQSKDYIKEITEGKQDEYIKSFAQQIKEYGSPVVLRFGHEMNGNWYPWGQRPDEYKASYRRVYEIFQNEGVGNVTWMWSVNATPTGGIENYYPGSEYVTSIGIDGFNFGTSQGGHTWVTFEQIFLPMYNIVRTYGKPVAISETASSEIGGRKEQWIEEMFETLNGSLRGVTEVIWFDLNKETDWRLNSSASSLSSFKSNK